MKAKKNQTMKVAVSKLWHESKRSLAIYLRLLWFVTSQKLTFLFANVMICTTAGLQMSLPGICGDLVDSVMKERNQALLKQMMLKFIVFSCLYGVSEFFLAYVFKRLTIVLSSTLRAQIFEAILNRSMTYHHSATTGELVKRLDSEIESVRPLCTYVYSNIFRNLIQLVFSGMLMLKISTSLTLCLLTLILPFVLVTVLFNSITEAISERLLQCTNTSISLATENFLNVKVVKSFTAESKAVGSYRKQLDKVDNQYKRHAMASSVRIGVTGLVTNLSLVVVMYSGLSLIEEQVITSGDLSKFLLYSLGVGISLKDISESIEEIVKNVPICQRVFSSIDCITPEENEGQKLDCIQSVQFTNVGFVYEDKVDRPALNQVTFGISSGQTVGLVGNNGSGKSTILSLLQKFYVPTKGSILVNESNITSLDTLSLRKQISVVHQEAPLFSGTLEYNITYGVDSYTKEDIEKAIALSGLEFARNKAQFPLGLGTEVGERGTQLSGGQRQRVALARALLKPSTVLVLDEAFSAVDAASRRELVVSIQQHCKQNGIIAVIVTHTRNELIHCDKIILLEEGKIQATGSYDELEKQGLLH